MSRRVISDLSRVGAQYSIVRNFQFSTARNHHYKLEVSGRIVRYKDEGKDKYETATKDDKAGQNFWDGTFPTDYEDKFFRHMASTTAKDDDAGSRQCFGDRMFHKCSCCDKAGQSFWDRIFPTDFDKIFRDFDKIFLDKASTTAKDNDAGSRQCFGDRMFHKCSCCDKDDEDNEDRSFQCSGDIMIKFGQCSCCDKVEYDEDGSRQCFGDRVFDQCSCCDKDKARTAANKYDN